MGTARKCILALALSAVAVRALEGQSSTVLVQAGAGSVSSFAAFEAFDDGDWFAVLDTSFAPRRQELWRNGVRLRGHGDLVSVPGAAIGDGDGQAPYEPFVDLNPSLVCPNRPLGILALVDDGNPGTPPVITSANDRGLALGVEILIQEGSVTTAPEVPAGTIFRTLHRSCTNAAQDVLILATLAEPGTGTEYAAVLLVDVDTTCALPTVRQRVLFKNGDELSNGDRMTGLGSTEKGSLDLNARGDVMFIAAFDSPIDRRVMLNGRVILRETQPLPGGLGAATSLQVAALDMNDSGDYVIQTRGNAATALVKGSTLRPSAQTTFIQAGQPVPDPDLGPHTLVRIGNSTRFANGAARNWAPALMTNSGDIVWYGEWYEPTPSGSETRAAIFVNHKAVVRTGSTQGGTVIERIGSLNAELRYEIATSPNGRYLLYEANAGAPIFQDVIFRMDLGESVPFGTVPQGCGYPYPPAGLEHVSDDAVPGDPLAFGGFPLCNGRDFFVRVDAPPPPTADRIGLVFRSAPSDPPCGVPHLGVQVLLGGRDLVAPLVQSVHQQIFTLNVPSSVPPGLVAYAQAFFLNAGGTVVGATNGLRFVFGAP